MYCFLTMHWCKIEATVNFKKINKVTGYRYTHTGRPAWLKAVCKFYLCVLQIKPKMGIIMAMVQSCRRSNECGQLKDFWQGDVFSMTSRSKYTKTGWRKEEKVAAITPFGFINTFVKLRERYRAKETLCGLPDPAVAPVLCNPGPTCNSLNASETLLSLSNAPVFLLPFLFTDNFN